MLGVGLVDGGVLLYDTVLVCERLVLSPHTQSVAAIAFHADHLLVTSSEDGTVATHVVAVPLVDSDKHQLPVMAVGSRVISSSMGGVVTTIRTFGAGVSLAVCCIRDDPSLLLLFDLPSATPIASLPAIQISRNGLGTRQQVVLFLERASERANGPLLSQLSLSLSFNSLSLNSLSLSLSLNTQFFSAGTSLRLKTEERRILAPI